MRYFAGARAAVGVDTETRDAGSLDELVGQIVADHGARLERVLTACSFLVDGTSTQGPRVGAVTRGGRRRAAPLRRRLIHPARELVASPT